MDKSIAFFSQMPFTGKVPRSHDNMRTEFAQMCALNADHHNLYSLSTFKTAEKYDHVILLIPKTYEDRKNLYNLDIVDLAKKVGKTVWFMQEGPSWIFQDLPVHQQFWHYNLLVEVDGILTENITDIPYFQGLVGVDKPIHSIPSLMIVNDDEGSEIYSTIDGNRKDCILGGNFVRWYGGFDSYIVAQELCPESKLYCVSMGRKQAEETLIEDITYLPYMTWKEWILQLANFKYGVHLMPTIAAGTFALNCSYLGIPCIGYDQADTQRILHPDLSVSFNDIKTARELAKELKNNSSFYERCSIKTKQLWRDNFSEKVFLEKMNLILK